MLELQARHSTDYQVGSEGKDPARPFSLAESQ